MRRVDKHFVCHESCAPRRSPWGYDRTVVKTGWMHSATAAPDNDSRDGSLRLRNSQTTAGRTRGLYTLEKSCCDNIRNQARSTMP
ncbi:hypothetical protein EQW76_24260 [Rhizobium sp. rho-13.1]|nr:hypothetical protein EQW76_24260 [Rhizobium sp. rho-13.1]TQY19243.1 hypothetical protein EQW74_05950 [Rhizobium sp. rho-1.1]